MIWLNGEFLSESEAKVTAQDSGLLVGDGVFETLRAWRGLPYALSRHFERLCAGAARFGLDVPSKEMLKEALTRIATPDAQRLRITLTGGGNCIVSAAPLPDYSAPAAIVISKYTINERSPLAGIKSTSYAANLIALAEAKRAGASEALMANTSGHLCEGTTSNVFCVAKDRRILTPPLSSGCLPGITRALVIELCQKHDLPCEERDIHMDEIPAFSEIFLTSSLRDIQPSGTGENPVASYLQPLLAAWRDQEIDP